MGTNRSGKRRTLRLKRSKQHLARLARKQAGQEATGAKGGEKKA
jgi:hypothetical protein